MQNAIASASPQPTTPSNASTELRTDLASRLWVVEGRPARAAAVTPSDTDDLPGGPAVALYVGVSGDITVSLLGLDGAPNDFLFTSAAVGCLPVGNILAVRDTGTANGTKVGLVALY